MRISIACLVSCFAAQLLCFSQLALAQNPTGGLSLDTECTLVEQVSPEIGKQLDEYIEKIDKLPSTYNMAAAHIELLRAAPDDLNYCDIERRLRHLSGRTYLLALSVEAMTGKPSEYSLVYPQPLFPTRSKIPRFAVWYERGGRDAARAKLEAAGMDPANNLKNLNFAGVLSPAKNAHRRYLTPSDAGQEQDNSSASQLDKILAEYRDTGLLSNRYNVPLMYAAEQYVDTVPDLNFTINSRIQSNSLNIFVVDSDPKRVLAGYRCNCFFVPHTSTIICDKKLLEALENWLLYGRGDAKALGVLADVNAAISDLLLHWLIGHEIGHFIHHDAFSIDATTVKEEPKPDKDMELTADKFAFENLPNNLKAWGHMTVNYLIQQLVALCTTALGTTSTAPIVVRENQFGHPNLLSRAFSLKEATGAVDFLLEAYERRLNVSYTEGVRLPDVCALQRAEAGTESVPLK